MSTVLDDPRVTARSGGGFTVVRPGGDTVEVLLSAGGVFGWTVCHGPNLDFVPAAGGGFAIKFPTAEAAIEAALQ
ncbi:hypothetical protein [Dactylosporangium sp. CA-139066]|uniref:hypothetical protein n=1 Tax=Dactylosporangium sp. CA-139066 TaxID=3239930 RepID=UPI003D924BE3